MKSRLWLVTAIAVALAAVPAGAQQSKDGLIDLDAFSRQRFYEVDGQLMTEQQKRAYEARKAAEPAQPSRVQDSIAMGDRRESETFDRAAPLMGNPVVPPPRQRP